MKLAIRLILCTLLAALALTMALFTLAGFRPKEPAPLGAYVLAEVDGKLAVFSREDRKHPLRITEIETASLRESDRLRVASGIWVDSPEELAQLLEDLND